MPFKTDIHGNQTAILKWLKSLGHQVVGLYDVEDIDWHERRSCKVKRRFESADAALTLEPTMRVYECKFCHGFHLTTPKSRGVST